MDMTPHQSTEIGERSDVGVHGMLVFGGDTIYLSHLPMFDPPHNYQVIIEASLIAEGSDPLEVLRSDRESTGERLSTFEPEAFDIASLVPIDPERPALTSFAGSIYRGHFERGGTVLLSDVRAEVVSVVHFKHLDVDAMHSVERRLLYLCFGKPGELYLAHEITARPDFDQVLSVRLTEPEVADAEFARAAPVEISSSDSERKDILEDRIQEGESMTGFFFQSIGPGGRHGFRAEMVAEAELYLESDELR